MSERNKLLIGLACVACALLGYALGQFHAKPTMVALRNNPRPLVRQGLALIPVAPSVDAGLPARVGPPDLPVRIALSEPRPGDIGIDPQHLPPRAPLYLDGGHDRATERRDDLARRAAMETPPPAAPVVADAPNPQLADVSQQLRDLRAQVAEQQARLQDREADSQERLAVQSQSLGALQRADSALALGDTDIDANLQQALSGLGGQAAAEIQGARDAITNGDLFAARQHLELAMVLGSKSGVDSRGPPPQ